MMEITEEMTRATILHSGELETHTRKKDQGRLLKKAQASTFLSFLNRLT